MRESSWVQWYWKKVDGPDAQQSSGYGRRCPHPMEDDIGFQEPECDKLTIDERLFSLLRTEEFGPVPAEIVRDRDAFDSRLCGDDVEPSIGDLILEARTKRQEIDYQVRT